MEPVMERINAKKGGIAHECIFTRCGTKIIQNIIWGWMWMYNCKLLDCTLQLIYFASVVCFLRWCLVCSVVNTILASEDVLFPTIVSANHSSPGAGGRGWRGCRIRWTPPRRCRRHGQPSSLWWCWPLLRYSVLPWSCLCLGPVLLQASDLPSAYPTSSEAAQS